MCVYVAYHRDPEGGVDAHVEECAAGQLRTKEARVEVRLGLEAERRPAGQSKSSQI